MAINLNKVVPKKQIKNSSNIDSRFKAYCEKYKITGKEYAIAEVALMYHKFRIEYLGMSKFSFPFKQDAPPNKQKTWIHFKNIYSLSVEQAINLKKYFYFHFTNYKNASSLTCWFIYSEQCLNRYLVWNKNSSTGVEASIALTEKEKIKKEKEKCEAYIKKVVALRGWTLNDYWKRIHLKDQYKRFPARYLKTNPYYRKFYKLGVYKGVDVPRIKIYRGSK